MFLQNPKFPMSNREAKILKLRHSDSLSVLYADLFYFIKVGAHLLHIVPRPVMVQH
jgi:hypothetical protein